ncbi:unnamed protein product, partial [Sphacelaria rigidula]
MTLNDRFGAAADAEGVAEEQVPAMREGDKLSHFQPPGRGAPATEDTVIPGRNNAGFRDDIESDDNGDRGLDDTAPSEALSRKSHDQYAKGEEEGLIGGSGSVHAPADDGEGKSKGGGDSSDQDRNDAESSGQNYRDEPNGSRARRAETAATAHHHEVAHSSSGQDLPSSPSSDANGGGDGNGSFSAAESRIELKPDLSAVADDGRSGSTEAGGVRNTRPRQRSRHGNEGGTQADASHSSSSADTPRLPPSRSQVFTPTSTVARSGEDSLKDGSDDPSNAISLKKESGGSTGGDATTTILTSPRSPP